MRTQDGPGVREHPRGDGPARPNDDRPGRSLAQRHTGVAEGGDR